LVYWTGHGGDSFFKFQDVEEITSQQIARVFQQMFDMKRYKEILFIADTCQAFTLGDALTDVPNVYMVGSSLRDENSYAHHSDATLGLSVIERYTHALVKFLEKRDLKQLSLKQGLVDHLRFEEQRAHVGYRDDACERKFHTVPMSDFFANVQAIAMRPMYKDSLEGRISWEATHESARRSLSENDADADNATCKNQEAVPSFQGVEPSDPLFIMALLLFLGTAVMIASLFV
jgi:phosphatidylinositol glycan class K